MVNKDMIMKLKSIEAKERFTKKKLLKQSFYKKLMVFVHDKENNIAYSIAMEILMIFHLLIRKKYFDNRTLLNGGFLQKCSGRR